MSSKEKKATKKTTKKTPKSPSHPKSSDSRSVKDLTSIPCKYNSNKQSRNWLVELWVDKARRISMNIDRTQARHV